MSGPKNTLAILAPHMAHLDPRVEWIANSLSEKYDVTTVCNYPADQAHEMKKQPYYKKHKSVCVENLKYTSYTSFLWTWISAVLPIYIVPAVFVIAVPCLIVADLIFGSIKLLIYIPKDIVKNIFRSYFLFRPLYKRLTQTKWAKNGLLEKKYYGLTLFGFMRTYFGYFFINHSSLLEGLRLAGKRFDVIYCNDLPSLLAGIHYKKTNGAKLVYDAHEIFWDSANGSPWIFKAFFKYFELTLLKNVDSFITVSPQITDLYTNSCSSLKNKSFTIPNACPLQPLSLTPKTSGHKVQFLFQGAFAPGRGLEDLIQAWLKIQPDNATLTLRGPDSGGIREKVTAMALPLIGKSIFFVPSVAEDELIDAAKAFDVGCIPYPASSSLNQRFCSPNKMGQYMQSGLAILAANTEFVSAVVGENECGLLYRGGDINDLAEKITTLIRSPDLLMKLMQNSTRTGQTKFNWGLYEDVLFQAV